jgi:hypothetical protein
LSKNPEFHARTKHIDIRYHFIRNAIEEHRIEILHVPTEDMPSDIFTKALPKVKHKKCTNFLLNFSQHEYKIEKNNDLVNKTVAIANEKKIYNEINMDLFNRPKEESFAHCVSEDFKMSTGFAQQVKETYKCRANELKAQKKTVGECAYLKYDNFYIFFLITKQFYHDKPTYQSLEKSLIDLLRQCKTLKVNTIGMPRIGAGLDLLDWNITSKIINKVYQSSNIQINVYYK